MRFSAEEEKFLLKFEKYVDKIYSNYIVIGFLFCITMVGLIIGIEYKANGGFLMAIFFGTMGSMMYIVSYTYKRLFKIITKMKQYIEALEQK